MHVALWVVGLTVLIIGFSLWGAVSAPRKARRLRTTLRDGSGRHADTFADQRRSYKRSMTTEFACGALFLVSAILNSDWGSWAVLIGAVAVSSLIGGVTGFVCLRIFSPSAQPMTDSDSRADHGSAADSPPSS